MDMIQFLLLYSLGMAFAQTFANKFANVINLQIGPIGAFGAIFPAHFIK